MFKRLLQLTGNRISDPLLSSACTLGDMYGFLRDTAKPAPASLFSTLHTEGQILREKAKTEVTASDLLRQQKKKADVGDLLTLGNVELKKHKPTMTEKRKDTGLHKVIEYALWERGLANPSKGKKGGSRTRKQTDVPIGTPLSQKSARFLAGRTAQSA